MILIIAIAVAIWNPLYGLFFMLGMLADIVDWQYCRPCHHCGTHKWVRCAHRDARGN